MQHKEGYLLLEVLIVVSLLVAIVMLALPQMKFLNKQLVFSEVHKIASICLFLRQLALVTHQNQELLFNSSTGVYHSANRTYSFASGIRLGFLPNMQGPPSKPHHTINQAITFKNNKISFFADGTISSGALYLVDSSGTYCYALTTPSAQAPFIRIYEYIQQGWALLS